MNEIQVYADHVDKIDVDEVGLVMGSAFGSPAALASVSAEMAVC